MPSIQDNSIYWGQAYDWQEQGEEWSGAWGNSTMQWNFSIFPRISRVFPSRRILEIAPGFGRWTKFLLRESPYYVGVDLSEKCIQQCQRRFATYHKAYFAVNDGKDLSFLNNESFDLIFSFDSLVHAEMEVFESYIPQILTKLSDFGICFIHHSNLAAITIPENPHWRAKTVSAEAISNLIKSYNGKVISQEIINWGLPEPTDCFTTFAKRDFPGKSNDIPIVNLQFMQEAQIIRSLSPIYS